MTNEEKVEAIRRWQVAGRVHPLTCGVDSRHEVLKPVEENGEIVLRCPVCNYRQTYIPCVVLAYNHEGANSHE